ncbi:helix-turn-helix transcriptional regulator [Lactiplantibacillus plantarum]|uniref:helix-turn-helix transcriptional regulator n=1 Tax=Lactiplantibacillus plantarum TaxID=1590 RepID=UPI0020A5F255|nr:helix-turn-helix transcriptional regulator [Lactiplantibacillus plantarum]MCG0783376.1 hypothetical protein [Lactiplantibacillus plantarum]
MIVKEKKLDVFITLEAARKNSGYSQKEAAKMLDMHYQTLAALEKDSSNISITEASKLSQLYQLPKNMLFFGNRNEFIRKLRLKETNKHLLERNDPHESNYTI